jgi:hypothetical protein
VEKGVFIARIAGGAKSKRLDSVRLAKDVSRFASRS